MYVVTFLAFLILPSGMAAFLLWRAYQMGVNRRIELTHQWISRPPHGIEDFARWFVWRDLVFGAGLLVCLALLLTLPRYFAAWIPLMALFGWIYQGFTEYALYQLRKRNPNGQGAGSK
ncbi:MAG: hypothetical protein RLZ81_761 [Pseudomonadota bacterium]|jgi:hypothetical protein